MAVFIRETDAIVLDIRDHGEADLIVTLFNHQNGRSTAIAKSAKKSKRRFVNKLELFSFLRVVLREQPNRSLVLLQEADLHAGFVNLRHDLSLYTAASVIREFLLSAIREGESDERLFRLTLWALHSLDQARPHLTVIALFLVRFFDYIGYRPELSKCLLCNSLIHPSQEHRFSIAGGGLVCRACSTNSSQSLPALSAGTIKFLLSSQDIPLERLHRLKVSGILLNEILNMLHHYGRHILQRDISSWKMLNTKLETTHQSVPKTVTP
jgi:DNA repair protein RecO (recombination protein O)